MLGLNEARDIDRVICEGVTAFDQDERTGVVLPGAVVHPIVNGRDAARSVRRIQADCHVGREPTVIPWDSREGGDGRGRRGVDLDHCVTGHLVETRTVRRIVVEGMNPVPVQHEGIGVRPPRAPVDSIDDGVRRGGPVHQGERHIHRGGVPTGGAGGPDEESLRGQASEATDRSVDDIEAVRRLRVSGHVEGVVADLVRTGVANIERRGVRRPRATILVVPGPRDPGPDVRGQQGHVDRREERAPVHGPAERGRGDGRSPVDLDLHRLRRFDVARIVRREMREAVVSVTRDEERTGIGLPGATVHAVIRPSDTADVVRRRKADGHVPGVPAVEAARSAERGGRDRRGPVDPELLGRVVQESERVIHLEHGRVRPRGSVCVTRDRRRRPGGVPPPVVRPVPPVLQRGVRVRIGGGRPVERHRPVRLRPRWRIGEAGRGMARRARETDEELAHVGGPRVVGGQGRQIPIRLDCGEEGTMVIVNRGRVARLDRRSGPDRIHRGCAFPLAVLIEGDEQRGPLRREHRAVEDLGDQVGKIPVPRRHVAVVHVVADVRTQPHVIRRVRRRREVVEEGVVADSRRDHACALRCIACDIAVVDEGIVTHDIAPVVGAVAVTRHILHVRLPTQVRRPESIDDV